MVIEKVSYMPRPDGTKRYNCTILDLCGREVIATLNSDLIDAQLAIDTLQIALDRRKPAKARNIHPKILMSFVKKTYTTKFE